MRMGVLAYEVNKSEFGESSISFSLLTAHEDVIIDTVKKAERDNTMILRVYEGYGSFIKDTSIEFADNIKISEIKETNLMEELLSNQDIKFSDNVLTFDIKPFEIKTFSVVF